MKALKQLGYFVFVPRIVTDLLRTEEEIQVLDQMETPPKFTHMVDTITLIKNYLDRAQESNLEAFEEINTSIQENARLIEENAKLIAQVDELAKQNKNLSNDNKENIDRNKNLIDGLSETIQQNQTKIESNLEAINQLKEDVKKASIKIYSQSKLFPENPDFTQEEIKNSINLYDPETSTNEFGGMVFDEDSGLDVNVVTDNGKEYASVTLDKDFLKDIPFVNNKSSIEIEYDSDLDEYTISPAPVLVYESESPEKEIILDHGFESHAIDIKVFKIDPSDIDMKTRIFPKIDYTSDNQVRLYFTYELEVHVIISKI